MIIIPGFKGGIADSSYEPLSQQTYQTAKNLDVIADGNILRALPVPSNVPLPATAGLSDIKPKNVIRGSDDYYLVGSATISGASNLTLHKGGPSDFSSATLVYTSGGTNAISDALEEFKNGVFFGYGTNLIRWGDLIGSNPAVTITIASPGVLTSTAHGLSGNDTVILSTTGTLPTGLTAGTVYYVRSIPTADTFTLGATRNGAEINTSGSQSGTHSITYNTKIISSGITTQITFLRNHKGMGKLFFIHDSGAKIGFYDNATVTLSGLTLDAADTAVGIEPLGRFALVGVRSIDGSSRFLAWDGTTSTVDDIYGAGDFGLQNFRVVGDTIHYVTYDSTPFSQTNRYYTMLPGGKPNLVKEFKLGTATGGSATLYTIDALGDGVMFTFSWATSTLLDSLIYLYGSGNAKSPKMLTQHRTRLTGAISDTNFVCTKNFADRRLYILRDSSDANYTIEIVGGAGTISSLGVYESNIFPINDGKPGTIKRILMNHEAIPSGCGFTVQLKQYSNYDWTTTPVVDTYQDLLTPEGSASSTGKTQSTNNTTVTEITGNGLFKQARFAQIKIKYDEISGTTSPGIVFPILIET